MTIQELIDELQKMPEERREEDADVYVAGPLSGFLHINSIEIGLPRMGLNIECSLMEQQ